jgi:hypothetical protein
MTVNEASIDGVDARRDITRAARPRVAPGRCPDRFGRGAGREEHSGIRPGSAPARIPLRPAERREAPRCPQRLPLTLSVFNQAALFQACMLNCCQGGVCVETRQRLLPRTSIQLRMQAFPAAAAGRAERSGIRTTALGEVKWCCDLGRHYPMRYRVGIRYYPCD